VHVLRVIEGPDAGVRFPLPENEPQLIGRSSEALPISDQSVSRRHAELTPDRGRWWVRDLDSANGTFLNDSAIDARRELRPGDELRCGATRFLFAAEPDTPGESPIKLLGPEELDGAVATRVGPDEPVVAPGADALRLATEHLRVIYELSAITALALKADELLPKVLDLVFREFQPQRGFVLLQPEGGTRLVPAAVRYRERPRTQDEGHIPVSRTIVQHVLSKAEGILSTNAMSDSRFRSGDSVREYGIRTAICVPVRSGRRVLGVIHIDSAVADFSWSEAELRLLTHIGQHAGLAVEGAELVQQAMQRERLAAMGETVANLSHSIKNILQGLRGGADAVELALNRGDVASAREGWPIVGRNLDRILQLTLNMLAWSKPRSSSTSSWSRSSRC
jgi:two-component system NtrC family sensor kinase